MKLSYKKKQGFLVTLGSLVLILAIPAILNLLELIPHDHVVNTRVHSVMEAVGGTLYLMITLLMYHQHHSKENEIDYPFIGLGFLSMGIFDIYHSLVVPGEIFVFSHVMSLFGGGFLFALIALPEKWRVAILQKRGIVFSSILLIWLAVILIMEAFPEMLPTMLVKSEFSQFANTMNTISGAGFVIASLFLIKRFFRTGESEIILITIVAILQALSRATFNWSLMWDNAWWIWHFYRLTGGILIFYVFFQSLNNLRKQLKETVENQDIILDAMPFGLTLTDDEQKIVQMNRSGLSMTEYTLDEIFGQPVSETIHREAEKQTLNSTENTESQMFKKSGDAFPILRSVVPIVFNEQNYYLEGFIDISRRYRIQKELENNEMKFVQIFNSVSNPLIVVDFEADIVDVNKAAMEQYGYSREEFMQISPFQLIHPDYHPEFERFLKELKSSGRFRGNTLDLRKDGSKFYTDLAGSVVTFNNKPHILASIRDITDIRETEMELNNTLKDLQRSNKELEEFAFIASHDLQEPLRKIKNYADIFVKYYEDKVDEKGFQFLQVMSSSAARMQQLINDLLAISRISNREIEKTKVNMNELVDAALEKLHTEIVQADAKIENEDLPQVKGNKTQLIELIYHIVSNSLKFSAEESPVIKIQATNIKDYWEFTITDNGIGFDKKYVEKIFKIFQRLNPREAYSGSGTGLTIAQKIVENHGGKIYAKSAPGRGTSIYFTIPK